MVVLELNWETFSLQQVLWAGRGVLRGHQDPPVNEPRGWMSAKQLNICGGRSLHSCSLVCVDPTDSSKQSYLWLSTVQHAVESLILKILMISDGQNDSISLLF